MCFTSSEQYFRYIQDENKLTQNNATEQVVHVGWDTEKKIVTATEKVLSINTQSLRKPCNILKMSPHGRLTNFNETLQAKQGLCEKSILY